MRTKICGMNDYKSLLLCSELNPEFLGFIFYKESKRFCNNLNPDMVKSIPKSITKAGVFVNEKVDTVLKTMEKYSLQIAQLHGDESPELCFEIKKHFPVIKAIGVQNKDSFLKCNLYNDVCDYFLFDTAGENYGGNGISFSHQLLSNYSYTKPFFLSGGIGADFDFSNCDKIPFALDINSKFEITPGVKDANLIKTFIQKINNYGNKN